MSMRTVAIMGEVAGRSGIEIRRAKITVKYDYNLGCMVTRAHFRKDGKKLTRNCVLATKENGVKGIAQYVVL